MTIKRLGFLASHRGSNMQSIIDACKQGRLQALPVVVISNNGDSGALDRAENEGIPRYHIGGSRFRGGIEPSVTLCCAMRWIWWFWPVT